MIKARILAFSLSTFSNTMEMKGVVEGGGGRSGADLNVLCKHFKKLKYNNLGLNCQFFDVKLSVQ